MVRVYIANAQPDERAAFCLFLRDQRMEIVGAAADWPTTLREAPATRFNMLLVDADLLPPQGIAQLREACSHEFAAILVSKLDARQQAASLAGTDDFISKSEVPKRLADRLQAAVKEIHS
jgi:DNA-binding NarL/FixJ family response regulator